MDCRSSDPPDDGVCPTGEATGCFSVGNRCFSCARALWETATEWTNFNTQWARLRDHGVPNAIVQGNHDNDGGLDANNPLDPKKGFAQFYGPSQMTGTPGYIESFVGPIYFVISHAWKFDLGGRDVLVVGMPFEQGDLSDHAAWADALIGRPEYASLPVIFLKHKMFNGVNLQGTSRAGWSQFGAPNADRIFMSVWGHFELGEVSIRPVDHEATSTSYDMLFVRSDWQRMQELEGRVGLHWLSLVRFYSDPNGIDEVEVEAFSPWRAAQEPNSPEAWFDGDPEREGATWLPRQPFSIDYDIDHDGLVNGADNCPLHANPGQEALPDGDSLGDVCDNCPTIGNENQFDFDGDGIGSLCDVCQFVADPSQALAAGGARDYGGAGCACICGDVNRDCVLDTSDALEIVRRVGFESPAVHFDEDYCDVNGDGACNSSDGLEITLWSGFAAPAVEFDPLGYCEALHPPDQDEDLVPDPLDNCLRVANHTQTDVDGDSLGDACDNCIPVANPGQEVNAQGAAQSVRPDGVPCACLCGDVNRDCVIDSTDRLELTLHAGFAPPAISFDAAYCDVNRDGACDSGDGLELRLWSGFAPPYAQVQFDAPHLCQ
ncbi:MAG: thrombospondin type 3 repeat-containing protein [Deltaproteobacteria bacterium]|nr:thrombospondin type 3 repeat-containing protein [Deltaproteobacteria bacterium]